MKRAVLILLLVVVASGPASAVIDPFYRNRMESGVRAFEQGNWDAAAHQLRIACFGHLDEPKTLAAGLIRLAIVEVKLGQEDSFQRLFSRLVELEERFSAYGAAPVPIALRQQFEGLAAQLVPARTLRGAPGFESVADRAEIERLATLPPHQRRSELEARLLAEPGRAEWLNEMAKLELAVRRPQPALDWLDRLPASAAAMPPATCLRQQAASEARSCERMDLSRPFCRDVPASVVEFRLQCLVEAGRWPEASSLIGDLDPEVRRRRHVTRLERKVRNNFDVTEQTDVPGASTLTPKTQPPTSVEMPAPEVAPPAEPAPATPPGDAQDLDRLRRRLDSAATQDELAALMSDTESFADLHPASRPARLLAAEVAYLQSDWSTAVRHFRQAGQLGLDEAHLAFYYAVALYETGDRAAAAEVLRPVASRLERTNFVNEYVGRILAPGV